MILVDTSVWIDHLRTGDTALTKLLENGEVALHPFVIGELALGNLKRREPVLNAMADLPQVKVATDFEVLHLIDEGALSGRGIGYVDAHLLASVRLTPGTILWTRDRRLNDIAAEAGFALEIDD